MENSAGNYFGADVGTSEIADNAVTLAKIADGTQGDILYYGAAGSPTLLNAGTAGQVLQTNGAAANPSWNDAGAWVSLGSQVLGGAAASMEVSGLTTTAYKAIKIIWVAKLASSAGSMFIDLNADATAGNYKEIAGGGSTRAVGYLSAIYWGTGEITINNSGATANKTILGSSNVSGGAFTPAAITEWNSTASITGVTLHKENSDVNLITGSYILVYGVK